MNYVLHFQGFLFFRLVNQAVEPTAKLSVSPLDLQCLLLHHTPPPRVKVRARARQFRPLLFPEEKTKLKLEDLH